MKKISIAVLIMLLCMSILAGCAKSTEPKAAELPTLRKLSWEGGKLTVLLGENMTTGCNWKTTIGDYSVMDYSLDSKFHLVTTKDGNAIGYLEKGFEAGEAGSTTITMTTPCDWDGSGNGYKYVISVTVNADGTISSAEAKEEANTAQPEEPKAEVQVEPSAEPEAETQSAPSAESKAEAQTEQSAEPETEAQANAGLYTYLGYYVEKRFVVDEEMTSWSVTLKADGTGNIYWGEDNQGPISEWSIEDGRLMIYAGVSEIEGIIANGIMLLDMGDGIVIGWAGPDAPLDMLNIISLEEFQAEKAAEQ